MYTVNPKLFSWFDQGKVVEAILGKNEYFLGGPTYLGEHDRLLVLRQLIHWASEEDVPTGVEFG